MSVSQRSTPDGLEIVDLAGSDKAEAVDLLTRGMRDNPVHVVAYGQDPERRERLVRAAFQSFFKNFVDQQPFGLRSSGRLVAVAGVAPPGTCQPTVGQRLRMAPTMAKFGPRATVRAARWQSEWARHDPEDPHSHLGPLAVDRDLRRQGLGSALLQEYCRRIDASGQVGYLETDRPENVRFYSRVGFVVVHEGDVLGVPNWYMRREAHAR